MPGKSPANKSDQAVQFRLGDAQRIASAVHAYETAIRDSKESYLPRAVSGGSTLRIGKTTATWSKGTLANITLWETGTPPNETQGGGTIENVVNKLETVGSGKWVEIQRAKNGSYYLVAHEDEDSAGLRIGKTSATWNKGSTANITLWEGGTGSTPSEGGGTLSGVVNLWATVQSGKWVGIQRASNGSYYLVVAEC